jgi:integrase
LPASASPAGVHLAGESRRCTMQFQRTAHSVLTVCLTPGDNPTEIPLTEIALDAFQRQVAISGTGEFLFPSELNSRGHLRSLRTAWESALRRAGIPYFRLYDLRSTYATRLSAGGVADEWVIQMLRQGDSQVFKRYSQMKLQMKREALDKINRMANQMTRQPPKFAFATGGFGTVLEQ